MDTTKTSTIYPLDPPAQARAVVQALEQQFQLRHRGTRNSKRTYFDTFDWRLFDRQLTLSATRINGVVHLQLESFAGEVAGEVDAHALPTFADSLPAGQLRDRLDPIIKVRRLLEKADDATAIQSLGTVDAREKTVVRVEVEQHALDRGGKVDAAESLASLRVRPVKGYRSQAPRGG